MYRTETEDLHNELANMRVENEDIDKKHRALQHEMDKVKQQRQLEQTEHQHLLVQNERTLEETTVIL